MNLFRIIHLRLSRSASRVADRMLAGAFGGLITTLSDRMFYLLLKDRQNWVPQPSMNIVLQMNRRVRRIEDADGSNRYLPNRWKAIARDIHAAARGHLNWDTTPDVLHFGAGIVNPLTLAVLLKLMGAGKVYNLEPVPCDPDLAIATLQEAVWNFLVTQDLGAFIEDEQLLGRLKGAIDLQALSNGDSVEDILSDKGIRHLQARGESIPLKNDSVDFIYSRSVLEHILNLDQTVGEFCRVLRPGGAMLHDVDLSAHDAANPFSHLYRDRQSGRLVNLLRKRFGSGFSDLNGMRSGDYIKLFADRGLQVVVIESVRCENLRPEAALLKDRYRANHDAGELDVLSLKLLVLKSASV